MKYYKTLFLFFSLTFLCTVVYSQQITFQKTYPGDSLYSLASHYELIQTPDNGYMAGNWAHILKTDSIGYLEWMREVVLLTPITASTFWSLDKTFDKGYVTTGGSALLKLDSAYLISWAKQWVNLNNFILYTIRETPDHGFIIGGYKDFLSINDTRFLLIKTDSTGNVLWSKVYDTPYIDSFSWLALAPDGGFIMCGTSDIPNSNYFDIVILKTDSIGNSQWAKRYNSPASISFTYHITNTYDGGYIICGYRNYHQFLLKIDAVGNKIWMKKYESQILSDAKWVEETPDHGFIVIGNLEGNTGGGTGQGAILMKTDSVGNLQWARALGNYGEVWTGSVKLTTDGGYVIGARRPGSSQSQDFAIIKTDSLGHTNGCLESDPVVVVSTLNDTTINVIVTDSILNVTTIPVTISDSLMGSELVLCAPVGMPPIIKQEEDVLLFPNPAHETINITYHFKAIDNPTFLITDITGRKIKELNLLPTESKTTVNIKDLAKGLYIYSINTTTGKVKTGKLVVE